LEKIPLVKITPSFKRKTPSLQKFLKFSQFQYEILPVFLNSPSFFEVKVGEFTGFLPINCGSLDKPRRATTGVK